MMDQLFEMNRQKDRLLTYTSSGIHRDDLIFTIEETLEMIGLINV